METTSDRSQIKLCSSRKEPFQLGCICLIEVIAADGLPAPLPPASARIL